MGDQYENADLEKGNSLVRNEEPPEKKQKDIQQFSGVAPVKRRPVRGFLKWTSDMFFSGKSWKEILKDVYENQIVPDVKVGFRNVLVSMIDMRMDKDFKPGSSSNSLPTGNFVTRYIDYTAAAAKATKTALEANKHKDEEIKQSGYELPSFTDRQTAIGFLASMKQEAERYGQLSVYDLAWKQGKTIDYTWDAYGWPKEQILAIQEPKRLSPPIIIGNSKRYYIIELPKASPLQE